MRLGLLFVLACGGTATTPPVLPPKPVDPEKPPVPITEDKDRPAIDPIGILTPVPDQSVSWLSPGPIQLDLGAGGIESPGGNRPIEVTVIDHQGNLVRAAVRLEHARFSLWSDRARLFGVIKQDIRVETFIGAMPMDETFAMLRPGARVKRIAHRAKQTQVRYVGALEVEGWVPDDVIVESGEGGDRYRGKIPTGRRQLMMIPGSIIRGKPEWGNNELALLANGYMLDTVQENQQNGWIEVEYTDGDVSVHGYTSKMQPPGRVHRLHDPDAPPPVITPNAKVASGTCLYSKRDGDRVGYIVGDRDVQLDDLGGGWWTLAVDTPWGPIPFAAKGSAQASLTPCAPAGAVPPPAGTTAP